MTSQIKITMGTGEWLMLIILSILWGGSFFFIGILVSEIPTLTIVALRVGLAAITLWGIVFIMGLRPPSNKRIWFAFLGMGLLNNVIPFTLIVWGQIYIASGLASIFNATTPIFTVIVAGLLLSDEKATSMKIIGVMTGFIGIVMMFGLPGPDEESNAFAQIAILGAALSYALAGVYGRRFKQMNISPFVTAAGQVTASSLILTPVALYFDGPPNLISLSLLSWTAIIGLAVLSTAIAYVLYFTILETAGATNLLLVTLLIPVSAILLGVLFLDETLAFAHFAGMACICFGLSFIDGRLWQRKKAIAL